MPYTPLAPVADAVYAVLALDQEMATLAPGGVFADVPPDPGYPFVWIEVFEDRQLGGLGTKPGRGAMAEMDLRVHVFQGEHGTMRDAQLVMERVIAVVTADDALTVSGYRVCGTEPFHDSTIPLPDEEINGVKVRELVARFRLFVEEA
jgi:hypothetical protein